MTEPKKNSVYELDITGYTAEGLGVARLEENFRMTFAVRSSVNQEKLDLMNEFIADESLKIAIKNYGILVAPKAYVEAAGAFTVEALDAYAAANGSTAGAYVAISSEEWYDTTDAAAYKLVGGLVDLYVLVGVVLSVLDYMKILK